MSIKKVEIGFSEVKGQNHAVKLLKTAVRTGRIAHAYLFCGPDGVGKNKTAEIFAQTLNCERFPQDEPCGVCDNCSRIKSGNFPDLIKVVPEGASLKISQIRKLQEKAYYRCYEGRFKVIMIDDAHLMTMEAANCLLKILEEPPEDTVFVLLAEDTKSLPETILSRVQSITFVPLDEQHMSEILVDKGFLQAADFPLNLARGSVQRATELLTDENYQKLLQDMIQLIDDIKEGGYQKLLSWSENLEKDKTRMQMILQLLATVYRDRLIIRAVGEQGTILKIEQLHDMAYSKAACNAALDEINKAYLYLRNNGNARLILDVLLISLHKIERKERGMDPIG